MEKLSDAAGRQRPLACVLPYVSPGRTVEEGMKYFNMKELFTTTARPEYLLPPSGKFETLEDLDGAAIAGPADVIIEQVRAFQKIGVEHFVFDFRTQFQQFEECVEMVGTEVLPLLHRGDGRKLASG
jgi:alkanesulfonate monooxygenase SsuD/methylene tetrahydromethanopterin reductase-like flavin-dependent oxidoreductase (luciferase family)